MTVLPHLEEKTRENCRNHPGFPAKGACAQCGSLFCADCLAWDGQVAGISCPSCRRENKSQRAVGGVFRFVTHPLFFIVVLLLAVSFSFINGKEDDGNLISEGLSKRVWFRRKTAIRYIQQASIARSRAVQLASNGHLDQARDWQKLVLKALKKAHADMPDSPCDLDFAIGQAAALGRSGAPGEALRKLENMRADIDSAAPLIIPYLSIRAEFYQMTGQPGRALEDWNRVLLLTSDAGVMNMGKLVDDMVSRISGGLFEVAVISRVQVACDTVPDRAVWRARALDTMAKYAVDLLKETPRPVESSNTGNGMKMERFD